MTRKYINWFTLGPWFVRFLGQEILRTNQKRTNEVRDGLGGTYVHMRMNEDRAHQWRQVSLVRKVGVLKVPFPIGPQTKLMHMALEKKSQ